jgi:hypothetical protein
MTEQAITILKMSGLLALWFGVLRLIVRKQ